MKNPLVKIIWSAEQLAIATTPQLVNKITIKLWP